MTSRLHVASTGRCGEVFRTCSIPTHSQRLLHRFACLTFFHSRMVIPARKESIPAHLGSCSVHLPYGTCKMKFLTRIQRIGRENRMKREEGLDAISDYLLPVQIDPIPRRPPLQFTLFDSVTKNYLHRSK